jgi:hypothetical protein
MHSTTSLAYKQDGRGFNVWCKKCVAVKRPEGANQFPAALSSKAVFAQSDGATNALADGDTDREVTGAKCGECTD